MPTARSARSGVGCHREHGDKYAAWQDGRWKPALRRRQSDESRYRHHGALGQRHEHRVPTRRQCTTTSGVPSRDPVGLPSGCPRRDTAYSVRRVGPGGCRDATKAGPKATAAAAPRRWGSPAATSSAGVGTSRRLRDWTRTRSTRRARRRCERHADDERGARKRGPPARRPRQHLPLVIPRAAHTPRSRRRRCTAVITRCRVWRRPWRRAASRARRAWTARRVVVDSRSARCWSRMTYRLPELRRAVAITRARSAAVVVWLQPHSEELVGVPVRRRQVGGCEVNAWRCVTEGG